METLEPILARQPFLQGLPERYLQLLTGCAFQARFEAGQFVLCMGEAANQFYLIRRGQVALELYTAERGPITIQTIGEGEALGWSWLVPPYRWELDGRALSPTLALACD